VKQVHQTALSALEASLKILDMTHVRRLPKEPNTPAAHFFNNLFRVVNGVIVNHFDLHCIGGWRLREDAGNRLW
jgi:hypothetical protein